METLVVFKDVEVAAQYVSGLLKCMKERIELRTLCLREETAFSEEGYNEVCKFMEEAPSTADKKNIVLVGCLTKEQIKMLSEAYQIKVHTL